MITWILFFQTGLVTYLLDRNLVRLLRSYYSGPATLEVFDLRPVFIFLEVDAPSSSHPQHCLISCTLETIHVPLLSLHRTRLLCCSRTSLPYGMRCSVHPSTSSSSSLTRQPMCLSCPGLEIHSMPPPDHLLLYPPDVYVQGCSHTRRMFAQATQLASPMRLPLRQVLPFLFHLLPAINICSPRE